MLDAVQSQLHRLPHVHNFQVARDVHPTPMRHLQHPLHQRERQAKVDLQGAGPGVNEPVRLAFGVQPIQQDNGIARVGRVGPVQQRAGHQKARERQAGGSQRFQRLPVALDPVAHFAHGGDAVEQERDRQPGVAARVEMEMKVNETGQNGPAGRGEYTRAGRHGNLAAAPDRHDPVAANDHRRVAEWWRAGPVKQGPALKDNSGLWIADCGSISWMCAALGGPNCNAHDGSHRYHQPGSSSRLRSGSFRDPQSRIRKRQSFHSFAFLISSMRAGTRANRSAAIP